MQAHIPVKKKIKKHHQYIMRDDEITGVVISPKEYNQYARFLDELRLIKETERAKEA